MFSREVVLTHVQQNIMKQNSLVSLLATRQSNPVSLLVSIVGWFVAARNDLRGRLTRPQTGSAFVTVLSVSPRTCAWDKHADN